MTVALSSHTISTVHDIVYDNRDEEVTVFYSPCQATGERHHLLISSTILAKKAVMLRGRMYLKDHES